MPCIYILTNKNTKTVLITKTFSPRYRYGCFVDWNAVSVLSWQALWQEMSRPDVVRAADEAARGCARLRHDENVLAAPEHEPAAIHLPERLRAPPDYTTDTGRYYTHSYTTKRC